MSPRHVAYPCSTYYPVQKKKKKCWTTQIIRPAPNKNDDLYAVTTIRQGIGAALELTDYDYGSLSPSPIIFVLVQKWFPQQFQVSCHQARG